MRTLTILFALVSFNLFGQVKDVNITISANHDADSVYILATHDTGTKAGRGVFRSLVYLAELIDPYLDAHKNMVDSISSEVVTEGQVEIKIWSVGDPIDSTTIDVSGEPTLINDFLIDGDSLCVTWSYFDAGVYLPQRQCILTSSIGGGGSQGIDDVLAIGQALTAARTITTGANEFNIDGTGTMLIGAVTGGNSTYVVVGDSDQQIYLNANEVATSNALNVGGAITASNLSGTNTGDQTSILGITGTKAQFNTAVTDGDFLYVGDVTSNVTHTGEVTGATALTVDKTAITNKTLVTAAVGDHVLIADASDSENLKKVTVQTIVDLASGGGDHGALTGLTDDDHTQYALLAGRAGSQILNGGNAANEDLTLNGTAHATKTSSYLLLQPDGGNVGIGLTAPAYNLHLKNTASASTEVMIEAPAGHSASLKFSNASGGPVWQFLRPPTTNLWQVCESGVACYFTLTPTTGRLGIGGVDAPGSRIAVNGNGTIGASYTTTAAPSNGFLIQGRLGLATTAPDKALEINLGTTDAFRLTYNDANGSAATFKDETISSTGVVTYNSTGSAPKHVFSDMINIPTSTPASASAAGTTGDIAWDADYIYICTATNTWKRVAIATW